MNYCNSFKNGFCIKASSSWGEKSEFYDFCMFDCERLLMENNFEDLVIKWDGNINIITSVYYYKILKKIEVQGGLVVHENKEFKIVFK